MQLLGLGILACLHILVHLKTFLIETEDFRSTGMHIAQDSFTSIGF